MDNFLLRGFIVGTLSIAGVTALSFPWKLRARRSPPPALFRAFTAGAVLRLLALAAIVVWGWRTHPLAGLAAILSFGLFFLLFTYIEVRLLLPKKS